MNDDDARAALRALGITPNSELIRNWLRAQAEADQFAATESSAAIAEVVEPHPSSKSRLEPVLKETDALQREPGPRKPGRPRIVASWFNKVAQTMVDGTSLGTALTMSGISLSKGEMRACYRNRTLQALYREARRQWLAQHYGRKPTLRAKIGRYM